MSEKLFEKASRMKLRFASPQGFVATEDLWDIPLTSKTGRANLDDIARTYSRELKTQGEESFVTKPAKKDPVLEIGFEIVKRVIEVRLEEAKAAKDLADKAKKRQKIIDLIARKEEEALGETDLDDLKKQLADL
jgi:hypothetical protein